MNRETQIEALLFVAGDEGISLTELAHLIDLTTSKTYDIITQLKESYEKNNQSALAILEINDSFILATKKEYASLLRKYAQSSLNQSISQAALECLAIIAYKQPITRTEIDQLRGVQSSGSLQKLVMRQLIEEKGRVDGPGRAILYGTSHYFLDYFGLKNTEELPDIKQLEHDNEKDVPTDLFFSSFKEQFQEEGTEKGTIEGE